LGDRPEHRRLRDPDRAEKPPKKRWVGRPHRDHDGTGPDLQVVAAGWLRRLVPSLIEDWAESVAGVVLGTAEGRGCCLLAYQRASTTVDAG
jgi:hypothetical protein